MTANFEDYPQSRTAASGGEAEVEFDRYSSAAPPHALRKNQLSEAERIEQLTGHIHLHFVQKTVWGVVAGLVGAAVIAGVYFGVLEANWHIFTLKPWWDHLLNYPWWPVYRHTAFRDIPEPAFAVMGVMTALAGPKQWGKRVSTLRLVTGPVILMALTFALAILGTWILNYAFGHPVAAWHAVGNLALGFIIGRVLHVFWAPIGATLQGQILDGHAEKAAARGRPPRWVRRPYAPPQLRQRMAKMYLDVRAPDVETADAATGFRKWAIAAIIVVLVLLAVLGFIGHYWVGTGHTIYFIQPVAVK